MHRWGGAARVYYVDISMLDENLATEIICVKHPDPHERRPVGGAEAHMCEESGEAPYTGGGAEENLRPGEATWEESAWGGNDGGNRGGRRTAGRERARRGGAGRGHVKMKSSSKSMRPRPEGITSCSQPSPAEVASQATGRHRNRGNAD